jgi:hypothetical protein
MFNYNTASAIHTKLQVSAEAAESFASRGGGERAYHEPRIEQNRSPGAAFGLVKMLERDHLLSLLTV